MTLIIRPGAGVCWGDATCQTLFRTLGNRALGFPFCSWGNRGSSWWIAFSPKRKVHRYEKIVPWAGALGWYFDTASPLLFAFLFWSLQNRQAPAWNSGPVCRLAVGTLCQSLPSLFDIRFLVSKMLESNVSSRCLALCLSFNGLPCLLWTKSVNPPPLLVGPQWLPCHVQGTEGENFFFFNVL